MNTSRPYHLTATVAFAILFVFSLLFYKERTIFADISFHLFEILRTKNYAIQNYRFGSFFTQSFPLWSGRAGLPLQNVLQFYSVGFILYYFSLYIICAHFLKQYKYALVLFSMLVFAVVDTFYWMQSELPQGMAFTLVFFAYMESQKEWFKISWQSAIGLLMLVTVVFFHPSLIFVFSFIVGFKYFDSEKNGRKKWVKLMCAYLGILAFKIIFFRTIYDRWAMGGLKNFYHKFPDYFTIQSNRDFLTYLYEDYYLLFFGLVAVCVFYFRRKKYSTLGWVCIYFFGYLFLTNVSYADGTNKFYLENLYLPLSLFILVPLVFHIWEKYHVKKGALAIFILIVTAQLLNIYNGHEKYTDRLSWCRVMLEKNVALNNPKIIVPEADVPMDTMMLSWGSAYEFWLLSTLEKGQSSSILIHENPDTLSWAMPEKKGMVTNWGVYPYEELPEEYFIFRDTVSDYKIMRGGE